MIYSAPSQFFKFIYQFSRFIIHANIPFAIAENFYFKDYLDSICPSYTSPSRYVLSHMLLDSEAAHVQIEELEHLKKRKRLTFLFDGWDDRLRRSLYGSVASEVNHFPVVLSLDDMTGSRGSAEKLLDVAQKGLKNMELEDGKRFIACTTDNLTVMQAFRRKFQAIYFWILVSRFSHHKLIFQNLYGSHSFFHVFSMVSIH
jgi:hypothetical protein